MERPIGVGAVEAAVGVDHFGLDPEAEVHAELVDVIDEGFEAAGEFFGVDGPVAEAGAVIVAGAEPAVIHDETLDAEFGGYGGKGFLAFLGDVEGGGFPGVVEDGAEAFVGEDFVAGEAVEEAGGFAEAVGGEAGVEGRGFEGFAGFEGPGEVEGVVASGDADLAVGGLFDGEAPVAGPGEGSEPDAAVGFGGAAGVEHEPGVGLVGGETAAAFEDFLSRADIFLLELPLAGPAAEGGGEAVGRVEGEIPDAGLEAFDGDGLGGAVVDGGFLFEDAGGGDAVGEGDADVIDFVLEVDGEGAVLDGVGDVLEDDVADAVGAGEFEAGFEVTAAAPGGVFLGGGHAGGVKAGPGKAGVWGSEVGVAPEAGSPVDLLELIFVVDAEDIADVGGGEMPEFGRGEIADFGVKKGDEEEGGEGRSFEHHNGHDIRVTHTGRRSKIIGRYALAVPVSAYVFRGQSVRG